MTRADDLLDTLVARIDETGFRAHGLHVRVADDAAAHRWTADEREEIHSVAKAVSVLAAGIAADEGLVSLDEPIAGIVRAQEPDITLRHLLYALSGWDGPGAAWRLHGAYGQLVIFVEDTVVTVSAHDHEGADAFTVFVAEVTARG